MNEPGSTARRILAGVAASAAVAVPWLLLVGPAGNFPGDWSNHLWMIGYQGDYFRAHATLPTVMNTALAVGLAQPVFYAWLFYPLMGILAAGLGTTLAVRLAVLAMLTIQFFALNSAGRKIFAGTRLAYTVTVSVIWATYSLTNLYNRGALAEYFATGFFVTALAFGTSAVVADDRSSRWFHGWLAGFFLILTAGTHAPTAVLAAAFVVLLALGGIIAAGRSAWRSIPSRSGMLVVGGLIAGGLILAPWVYANGRFASQLALVRNAAGFIFRPENCDTWWGRFIPFPYDAASMADGLDVVGTPYLEAQINVVLLIVLLWNLGLTRRCQANSAVPGPALFPAKPILLLACSWFLVLTAMSVSPGFARCFEFLAPYIQYAYRLVSHCNAALLVAVFASGAWVARLGGYRRFQSQTNVVATVCLAIAVLGVGIKLQHAAAVIGPDAARPGSVLRRQMEVVPDYTLPGLLAELPQELNRSHDLTFPVAHDPARFGQVSAVNVESKYPEWVRTNAVVFAWTEIWIDGKIAGAGQLARVGPYVAVFLPTGTHEVRATWQPDATWSGLHRLSQVVFALVLLLTLCWAATRLFRQRGVASAT